MCEDETSTGYEEGDPESEEERAVDEQPCTAPRNDLVAAAIAADIGKWRRHGRRQVDALGQVGGEG